METKHLTWGILYYLLGMRTAARSLLQEGWKPQDLTPNLTVLREKLAEHLGQDEETQERRLLRRHSIGFLVREVLGPRDVTAPRLGWEGERGHPDSLTTGFSRDPFRPLDQGHRDHVALAIVCYLLRAHMVFFSTPKPRRDYSFAKYALNDLHQAYHLTWRLYQGLAVHHQVPPDLNLRRYTLAVMEDPRNGPPGESPFFIYSALVLCEIFRGNIYFNIGYRDEANRHYRHAQRRFETVWCNRVTGPELVTDPLRSGLFAHRTMIKALYERAKVLFDLGQFLESLDMLVYCLVLLGSTNATSKASLRNGFLQKAKGIRGFIEAERAPTLFDRDLLTRLFGNPIARTSGWPKEESHLVLTPKELCPLLEPAMDVLATGIMTRLGFLLYTIRPRTLSRDRGEACSDDERAVERASHREWLRDFFRFDLVLQRSTVDHSGRNVAPCWLGQYCETLFQEPASEAQRPSAADDHTFGVDLERRLAYLIRQRLLEKEIPQSGLDERDFYKAILASVTQNISNIVTIPRQNRSVLMRRGYRHRRAMPEIWPDTLRNEEPGIAGTGSGPAEGLAKSGGRTVDKFVVLRRWQSFNPKIPRSNAHSLRGGGYLLIWHGKGIAIDPGYDFIQNLYDEGFSLEDVDAIIVTHSHPDHDDDLSSLTTLVREWNDYHERTGQRDLVKKLDVFLNESAHWKFAAWLQASDVKLGRVIPLPVLCWHKDSCASDEEKAIRGRNVRLELISPSSELEPKRLDTYEMTIEIVPAWHDDVIGRTSAVGLKFHLQSEGRTVGILGYTGDTGAYGLDIRRPGAADGQWRIDQQFADCDVLVGHLGDVKLLEILSSLRTLSTDGSWKEPQLPTELLRGWFSPSRGQSMDRGRGAGEFRDRVAQFLDFLITLDLVHSKALRATVGDSSGRRWEIEDYLGKYLKTGSWLDGTPHGDVEAWREGFCAVSASTQERSEMHLDFSSECVYAKDVLGLKEPQLSAYLLLAFLCVTARLPWQYKYHLGVFGIYRLFEAMVNHAKVVARPSTGPRVFVVGELPEELTSYRHMIAHWLNATKITEAGPGMRYVYAYTGDIGLHIALEKMYGSIVPKVRCMYCNCNNELIGEHSNYHTADKVFETPIKRRRAAMVYLCVARDHHPADRIRPRHFLSRPEIRII